MIFYEQCRHFTLLLYLPSNLVIKWTKYIIIDPIYQILHCSCCNPFYLTRCFSMIIKAKINDKFLNSSKKKILKPSFISMSFTQCVSRKLPMNLIICSSKARWMSRAYNHIFPWQDQLSYLPLHIIHHHHHFSKSLLDDQLLSKYLHKNSNHLTIPK